MGFVRYICYLYTKNVKKSVTFYVKEKIYNFGVLNYYITIF
jgi:hypothetical protein